MADSHPAVTADNITSRRPEHSYGAPMSATFPSQGPFQLHPSTNCFHTGAAPNLRFGHTPELLAIRHGQTTSGLSNFQAAVPRRRFHTVQVTSYLMSDTRTSDSSSGISGSYSTETTQGAITSATLCPPGDEHVDALLNSLMFATPQRRPAPLGGPQAAARKLQRGASGPMASGGGGGGGAGGLAPAAVASAPAAAKVSAETLANRGADPGAPQGAPGPAMPLLGCIAGGRPLQAATQAAYAKTIPAPEPRPPVPSPAFVAAPGPASASASPVPDPGLAQVAELSLHCNLPASHMPPSLGPPPSAGGLGLALGLGWPTQRPQPAPMPVPIPASVPQAPPPQYAQQLHQVGPFGLGSATDQAGLSWIWRNGAGVGVSAGDDPAHLAGGPADAGAAPGAVLVSRRAEDPDGMQWLAGPDVAAFRPHAQATGTATGQKLAPGGVGAGRQAPRPSPSANAAPAYPGRSEGAATTNTSNEQNGREEPATSLEQGRRRAAVKEGFCEDEEEEEEEEDVEGSSDSEEKAPRRRTRKRAAAQRGRVASAPAVGSRKELCRERNRTAQRRFRERQRELIRALQEKVDDQEALISSLRKRLAVYEAAPEPQR